MALRGLVHRLFVLILGVTLLAATGCGGGGGTSVPTIPDTGSSTLNFGTTGVPGGGGTSNPLLSPSAPPGLPSLKPPLAHPARTPNGPPRLPSPTTVTLNLPAGWSLISFPLADVTSVTGLSRQLYSFTPVGFSTIDPVTSPASVDTRLGYFAYCDAPETVTVQGTANSAGAVSTSVLQAGWSLVGCPSQSNLPLSRVSFTRGNVTRTIEECTSISTSPTDTWLSQYAWTLSGNNFNIADMQANGQALQPRQGLWLFVWQDVTLNFNPVAPSPAPSISSLSAASVSVGDSLTINGSGFGTQAAGNVTIGGNVVSDSLITSWTGTQIQLKVPSAAQSGDVVVYVGAYPSSRAAATKIAVSGTGTGGVGGLPGVGSLSGIVVDYSDNPLANCQIMLDTGDSTTSDASGKWSITGVSAGTHLLYASLIGYRTGIGQVTVDAGLNHTVQVQLAKGSYGGGGGGGGTSGSGGTLWVTAYSYYSGGTRVPVQRIDVQDKPFTKQWTTNAITDVGNNTFTLQCSGATIGKSYTIKVTWADGQSITSSKTLYSDGQTEDYYNP